MLSFLRVPFLHNANTRVSSPVSLLTIGKWKEYSGNLGGKIKTKDAADEDPEAIMRKCRYNWSKLIKIVNVPTTSRQYVAHRGLFSVSIRARVLDIFR